MKHSYMIKKTLLDKNVNKIQHVFMTDGSSQVLEMSNEKMATHFVEVMNNNTDSGCIYEVITVKNNKK
tara:strand:- start:149 stop:352 length:204 start_codon:yes stop_codon:yes gene_type:complete